MLALWGRFGSAPACAKNPSPQGGAAVSAPTRFLGNGQRQFGFILEPSAGLSASLRGENHRQEGEEIEAE